VVEVGTAIMATGGLARVRPLGVLAMIDDGELDWKVIAISADDPMAGEIGGLMDLEERVPGVVSGIREWFRWYKTPDGKPVNQFAYKEQCLDEKMAVQIIEEAHDQWRKLVDGKVDPCGVWTGR